jgi:hypothetical protein
MRTFGLRCCLATAIAVVGVTGSWIDAANGACNVLIWARLYAGPEKSAYAAKDVEVEPNFRVKDQFVVCFRIPEDGYVSLWDAPPRGPSVSRLYPNILTHRQNNAMVRAEWLKGGQAHCYGMPDTFPLFFPADQGVGEGKLSVHLTRSLNDQPTLEDYEEPGRSILRATLDTVVARSEKDNVCGRKVTTYFKYRVSN